MNSDFETRFPSIKIIKVDCEVKEKGIHHIKNLSFSNENIENNISCGDLNCTSGGIRVFDFVQAMLEKKEVNQSFSSICKGYQIINNQRKYCSKQFLVHVEFS